MKVKHSFFHVGFALSPTLGPEFGELARKLTRTIGGMARNTPQERFVLKAVLPYDATKSNQEMARLAAGLNWQVVVVGDSNLRGNLLASVVIGTQGTSRKPLEVVADLSRILVCVGDDVKAVEAAFLATNPGATRQIIDGASVLAKF